MVTFDKPELNAFEKAIELCKKSNKELDRSKSNRFSPILETRT